MRTKVAGFLPLTDANCLVIGSTALKHSDIGWRDPADTDLIVTEEFYQEFLQVNASRILLTEERPNGYNVFMTGSNPLDLEVAKDGNSGQMLLELLQKYPLYQMKGGLACATPELVYTLKMSHRYLKNSPYFKKTMDDILVLRKLGYGIPDYLMDWYKQRMKETYSYAHPRLNQSREDFFSDDGINYIYDHDTIHEAVKSFATPAFELIKEDKAEVFCSKEKFYSSPEHIKLATVLEETYVLALERSQIPFNFEIKPQQSFLKALEKVCTSITSGWWREYAWENYHDVLRLYDPSYVKKFHKAKADGVIKPYKAKVAA